MRIRVPLFVLGVALVVGAVFAPFSLGAASTSLPTCTTAQLVPTVSELAVDQGLPQGGTTYARLARGKETLVRAYLTAPSGCALSRSESIQPTSATLTVNTGVGSTTFNNVDPLSSAVASAQQISATSDPYFDVPSSTLAPANNGAAFNATFTVQVTYRSANGTTVVTGTTPTTATNASKTMPVDQKTNAIRVLVVPMGDPTATVTQFSSAANAAIQQQMTAVDRVFPVESGTGDLRSQSGGVRYTVNGGLLDAASLGLFTNGKFCSNATNYASSLVSGGAFAGLTLKGQLQQALADYNAVNPAAPADVVLGAVDENIAWASAGGTPCNAARGFTAGGPDDGRASTPVNGALGQPAWARITYSTSVGGTGGPSPVVMELAHNFGISHCCTSFHSPNVAADLTAPNRGMNVLQKKVLFTGGTFGASHSAMNYNTTSVPYTADNLVFEPGDWADMLCDLGGVASTTSTCPLASSAGTSTGVAANAFSVNGTFDGSGTRVTNSYATSLDTGLQTQGDPNSTTHLLLSNGSSCSSPGTTLLDFGMPVLPDEGHGPNGAEDDGGPSSFHALVPMPSGATTVQVTVNGIVKYCRSPQAAPDLTSTTVQPADLGNLLTSFQMPGGGNNGRAIAFDSKSNTLYGTFADNTELVEFSTSGQLIHSTNLTKSVGSLSYDPGSDALYGGNLNSGGSPDNGSVYSISTGAAPAVTGTVFQKDLTQDATCRGGNPGAIDGLAYFPASNSFTLSGDAAKVAHNVTSAGGDGWVLGAGFPVAAAGSDCNSGIARDGNGGAWYALLGTSGDTTTFVHRPTPDGTPDMSFQAAGFEAEDIDYDPVTFAPQCALWVNEATGGTPQIRAYSVPCSGGQPGNQKAVTFTATGDNLVGTAYVSCGGNSPKFPVADSLTPVATEEAVSTFTFAFSPTLSCASGTPTVITSVSDGINVSPPSDPNATKTFDASQKDPVATINAPISNETYGVGSKITLNGSGFDYTDGALDGAQLTWKVDSGAAGIGRTPPDVPATAGDHTVQLTVTDAAGKSVAASVTIHVDGTPPVLTLTPGSAGGTENVAASDNASGDSGLSNVFCSANALPTTLSPLFASGPTYSGSFSYSTATIEQLSCTAYDKAGNQTTVNTISQYAPAGQACGGSPGKTVLQPVNPDGSSVFKKGSTIPVKFTVCDGTGPVGPSAVVDTARATPPTIPDALGGGQCVQPTSAPQPGTPVFCKVSGGAASVDESVYSTSVDTAFRWSSPQWVFNMSTSNLAGGSVYIFYIPLNDDTNSFFRFGLR